MKGSSVMASPADTERIPVAALRPASIDLLSGRLNPHKVIPTDEGLPRDWRGLAHLIGLNSTDTEQIAATANPTAHLIKFWTKGNVKLLRQFLETLDRFDVIDDSQLLIEKDIEVYLNQPSIVSIPEVVTSGADTSVLTVHDVARLAEGQGPQLYDAFLLYADEDVDFAMEIVNKLEQDFNMMICLREHLVGGVTFEHDAVTKLIAERCRRLLVVVSPVFLESSSNKFVVTFAQAIGIDRRERKVIPIIYKKCMLPPELSYYFALKYYLKLPWDFWDTLRKSIATCDAPNSNSPSPWMSHRSPQFETSKPPVLSIPSPTSKPTTPIPVPKLVESTEPIKSTLEQTIANLEKLEVEAHTPSLPSPVVDKAKNPLSKAYKFITKKSTKKSTEEAVKKEKRKLFGKKKTVSLAV